MYFVVAILSVSAGLLFVNVDVSVKALFLDKIPVENLSLTYLVEAGSWEFSAGVVH